MLLQSHINTVSPFTVEDQIILEKFDSLKILIKVCKTIEFIFSCHSPSRDALVNGKDIGMTIEQGTNKLNDLGPLQPPS